MNRPTTPNESSENADSTLILQRTPQREISKALETLVAGGELSTSQHEILGQVISVAAEREPQIIAQLAIKHEMYSGPLPHPEQLNGYDPDTRAAIVAMAVKEQEHTHAMQKKGLGGAITKDRIGQICAVIIAVSGLAAAAWISQFSGVAAAVIGSVDLLGMVAAFVAPRAFEKMVEMKSSKQTQQEQPKTRPRSKKNQK